VHLVHKAYKVLPVRKAYRAQLVHKALKAYKVHRDLLPDQPRKSSLTMAALQMDHLT